MTENHETLFTSVLSACLAGVLFCSSHLLNHWLFQHIEISDHINLVYLPAFIRVASVLILGLMWGTLGTAIGGLLLLNWSPDANLWIGVANLCVSASVAAVAVLVLQLLLQRRLSVTRLSDLLRLSVLYALLNALLHHALWSVLDTSQLLYPSQVLEMVIGDVNGVVIGALLLRWGARKINLTERLRNRATPEN